MKKLLASLVIFFVFLFLPSITHADSNFSTSLTGTYTINANGMTHGVFHITLKNLSDRYYASTYAIQLGFKHMTNVLASDTGGPLAPEIKDTPDGEQLNFAFNHRAIGLGSISVLTFSFDTPDIAVKNGNLWEVNIPGLKNDADFADFNINVTVPQSFGQLSYEKPNIGNSLQFTKDQLGQSGISLAFGDNQVYHFHLAYHLKNNQLFPVKTAVALPPDTSYQRISIDSLEPRPVNVVRDLDGNWLAQYMLNPGQIVTVYADGRAEVELNPQGDLESDQELKEYLLPTTYWQSNNAKIIALAKQLQDPYAIYEYVVKTLKYDYRRVNDNQERLGAIGVLSNPSSAVCLEFTDLFIALARAAGIPAREVDGYAYTQNSRERPISLQKDILHAWPEYYDKDTHTWVMVDPTWESTTGGVDYFHTFDFDHIGFVIKGRDPDYPVPAGGYKLANEKDQDVSVDFAANTDFPTPQSSFDFTVPTPLIGGLTATGDLTIHNTGSVSFSPQTLHVTSTLTTFPSQDLLLPDIPPFAKADIPITLGKTTFLTNQKGKVTISLTEREITRNIAIVAFSNEELIVGGISFGLLIIALFVIARRPWRVSVS